MAYTCRITNNGMEIDTAGPGIFYDQNTTCPQWCILRLSGYGSSSSGQWVYLFYTGYMTGTGPSNWACIGSNNPLSTFGNSYSYKAVGWRVE